MAKVKDVMSRQVVSIDASDSLVGILTETDMLRLIVRSDASAPECAETIVFFP